MKKVACSVICALLSIIAGQTASAANVNVIHGIDGRDLGLSRELPVDIAVNGTCALKGVTYTQSALVELSPASYKITVHPANGKCSLAPVITESVVIPNDASRSFSAVASLTEAGAPRLAVFNNSTGLSITPVVAVRHLAKAGAVFARFDIPNLGKLRPRKISNGNFALQGVLALRFKYTASVSATARGKAIASVSGVARKQFVIHNIVGSAANGFAIVTEKLNP